MPRPSTRFAHVIIRYRSKTTGRFVKRPSKTTIKEITYQSKITGRFVPKSVLSRDFFEQRRQEEQYARAARKARYDQLFKGTRKQRSQRKRLAALFSGMLPEDWEGLTDADWERYEDYFKFLAAHLDDLDWDEESKQAFQEAYESRPRRRIKHRRT